MMFNSPMLKLGKLLMEGLRFQTKSLCGFDWDYNMV